MGRAKTTPDAMTKAAPTTSNAAPVVGYRKLRDMFRLKRDSNIQGKTKPLLAVNLGED